VSRTSTSIRAPAPEAQPCTWGDPVGAESRRSSRARTAAFTAAARRVRQSRAAIARSHPVAPALLRVTLRQPCPPGPRPPFWTEAPKKAFEFPSLNEKEFGLSGKHCRSWKVIQFELDKCELRCANCHREKHSNEKNYRFHIIFTLE
jgi:hypothetical protein